MFQRMLICMIFFGNSVLLAQSDFIDQLSGKSVNKLLIASYPTVPNRDIMPDFAVIYDRIKYFTGNSYISIILSGAKLKQPEQKEISINVSGGKWEEVTDQTTSFKPPPEFNPVFIPEENNSAHKSSTITYTFSTVGSSQRTAPSTSTSIYANDQIGTASMTGTDSN